MKFNPRTKEIFTDNGHLIKRLDCPYKIKWENLIAEKGNPKIKLCLNCNHPIIDTANFNDYELLGLIEQKPNTCLKVDLNQNNLKVISNGIREQK